MITLKEWMELVDYRITEGGEYHMYAPRAYSLSSWNGEQDGYSFEIIFNTHAQEDSYQEVYCVEVCDYKNNRAYRLINPDYADMPHDMQAWDDVDWIDLEIDDDFIQKALGIKEGKKYDTRISMPLTLSDEDTLRLFQAAHEADKTLNQYVEDLLRQYLDSVENTR
jgi:hypothetical protein